jgi:glycosyltransferase involved in cell wall biosynthesis
VIVSRHSYYCRSDSSIAVVIPSIPPRAGNLLQYAVQSVFDQELPPAEIHVVVDHDRHGAGTTRQVGLDSVSPGIEWVAFLDDDDLWHPNHLRVLAELGREADVCYSWFDGNDPFPMHRGRAWNPQEPHHLTMNIMVRNRMAQFVGFPAEKPDGWVEPYEDWRFILGLNDIKARFAGTPEVTWTYRAHGANTSGKPDQW